LKNAIELWTKRESGKLTRSEAIRRLLEFALQAKGITPYDAIPQVQRRRVSSAQIRAARALLKWSAADLAREASLGVNTVGRAESADGATALTAANELAIRRALELAGVEFIEENGEGPGVRRGKPQQKKGSRDWR
jgi:hypothetical protein